MTPAPLPLDQIVCADALTFAKTLPSDSVDLCLTSPPYFHIRDYGVAGQWGSEATVDEYLTHLWTLYDEVLRVLKPPGVCFVNLSDTYQNDPGGQNGRTSDGKISAKLVEANRQSGRQDRRGMSPVKRKSLMLVPERFVIGMAERGWIVRNRICWTKPNAMPSSVTDRFSNTWEYVYFFSKRERYWSDIDAVRVPYSEASLAVYASGAGLKARPHLPSSAKYGAVRDGLPHDYVGHPLGRNPGDTWTIHTQALAAAHFAVWPEELARRIICFGCPPDGVVWDPFMGAGTSALVALQEGRHFIGSDLSPEYVTLAEARIAKETGWCLRPRLDLAEAVAG